MRQSTMPKIGTQTVRKNQNQGKTTLPNIKMN